MSNWFEREYCLLFQNVIIKILKDEIHGLVALVYLANPYVHMAP